MPGERPVRPGTGGPEDGPSAKARKFVYSWLPKRIWHASRSPGDHSSESCTPLPEGGTNWSTARLRRVRVSSNRLLAISKRRAICQA